VLQGGSRRSGATKEDFLLHHAKAYRWRILDTFRGITVELSFNGPDSAPLDNVAVLLSTCIEDFCHEASDEVSDDMAESLLYFPINKSQHRRSGLLIVYMQDPTRLQHKQKQ
jgi:hypothetical protein